MSIQPELALEDELITQLGKLEYERVLIEDEAELLANLKLQLEKFNEIQFSDNEFKAIRTHLSKGNVFERAKILRDKMLLTRDDGTISYINFLDSDKWCQNLFQVTNQVTVKGKYENRYDVTILINGLPLIQIELKRRGMEIKEAFKQVVRYWRHSYGASDGLFTYIQLFVISNGVNTKYFANNKTLSFEQTFFWSDVNNKRISQLEAFAENFLEPCHLSKMICQYIVLNETSKNLMVLRPYQYYACEAIVDRVKNSVKNGYIWHTTGSGKTLTSFKVSQVLTQLHGIKKVVFVVDRRDLDDQTTREFNSFSGGSVDGTDSTKKLVQQFGDDNVKLVVTTIQKLNSAISKSRHSDKMQAVQNEKMVFIFDECHRSQFGTTHTRIKQFFGDVQMFGFTGTPIFAENAATNEHGKRTTTDMFDECLHKYVITDAIRDENVLRFSVEYVGKYKQKDSSKTKLDIDVEDIDTSEVLESEDRLSKITDYIIANHNRKTHDKTFTAFFCISNIRTLIRYYDIFNKKKEAGEHDLRIATIFSYGDNEDLDADGMGEIAVSPAPNTNGTPVEVHSRERLEDFIGDYNKMYTTNFTTKDSDSFYNYYKDISKRVRDKQIDVLLVVNMFLTGFDSKYLNTLYVDKNLKHHGLIQAFSRTNRIVNQQKSQGNIVSFRNLKKATDDAVSLFSNKEAIDIIVMEPLEHYVAEFNNAYKKLIAITPTAASVDDLVNEEEDAAFIKAFRELVRLKNIMTPFADFSFKLLDVKEQDLEDYKSKYLDMYDKYHNKYGKEKVSILADIDFELELIQRDDIDVTYILKLLEKYKGSSKATQKKIKANISDLLGGNVELRSKRALIEEFIEQNTLTSSSSGVSADFDAFWSKKQNQAFQYICKEEGIQPGSLSQVIREYLFSGNLPLPDAVIAMLPQKPKILERKLVVERITNRMLDYVDVFIKGVTWKS